jgi:protein TonB
MKPTDSTSISFTPFLLAAVALHAGVLAWLPSQSAMQLGGTTLDAVAVSLTETPASTQEATKNKPNKPQEVLRSDVQPAVKMDTASAQPEPAKAEDAVTLSQAITQTEVTATVASEASLASIRQQVQTELARHFHYPNTAIRRNWSGTVEVVFRVEPDGRVYDVRMKKSSGRSVLDEAALQSMRKVERIPLDPQLKLAHAVELALPVIYRLQG